MSESFMVIREVAVPGSFEWKKTHPKKGMIANICANVTASGKQKDHQGYMDTAGAVHMTHILKETLCYKQKGQGTYNGLSIYCTLFTHGSIQERQAARTARYSFSPVYSPHLCRSRLYFPALNPYYWSASSSPWTPNRRLNRSVSGTHFANAAAPSEGA